MFSASQHSVTSKMKLVMSQIKKIAQSIIIFFVKTHFVFQTFPTYAYNVLPGLVKFAKSYVAFDLEFILSLMCFEI
jgi:hypothetical protein